MNSITRDLPDFSDEDIIEMVRAIEPHDRERINPPTQVWDNLLAEVEVERASAESQARRASTRSNFSPRVMLAAAAAVVLIVGVALGLNMASSTPDPEGLEVAAAAMTDEGLPVATTAVADARIVCIDTECAVEIDLTAVPNAGDGDLELWVINGDVSDMHSLGLITESGSYELPDGVTAEDFPIVDISIEPRDGVAAHSGQSVLRGIFEPV